MSKNGAIALLLGAGSFYAFFHFAFGVEALTLFQVFFIKALAFTKAFIARLTWEMVYIFTANFFKKAAAKFIFVQAPMAVIVPILTVMALRPATKRRLRKRAAIVKYRVSRVYRKVLAWYEHWFGRSAVLVFVMSCLFAALTFVFFMWQFGFEFFIWLGSWSWVTNFFRSVGSFFGPLFSSAGGIVRSALFRFPMVGAILAFFGSLWRERIAPKLPSVETKRKQMFKSSLGWARDRREHRLKVYFRWERRRERRKERRREIRSKRKERRREQEKRRQEQIFMRMMWVGGATPRWDRIGFSSDEYFQLIHRAHDGHERLYIDHVLGGKINPTYLEGGDVPWRVLRK